MSGTSGRKITLWFITGVLAISRSGAHNYLVNSDGSSRRAPRITSARCSRSGGAMSYPVRVRFGRYTVSILLAGLLLSVFGCGSSQNLTGSNSKLTIYGPPNNVTAPLGQTATFEVFARAPAALTYQWERNNVAISGANQSSYTTPPVTASDTGTTYAVVVSDGKSSITSVPATLTVGPRSPMTGDLRFQQVDSPAAAVEGYGDPIQLIYPMGMYYPVAIGSPLRMGLGQCVPGVAQDCWWDYDIWPSPTSEPVSTLFWIDKYTNLTTDLSSVGTPFLDMGGNATGDIVVTSLDIETGEDVFAESLVKGPAGGFDMQYQTASLQDLPAEIDDDGANGRVVTAISFNDATGDVVFLSYGWTSAANTAYDTEVQTVPYDDIGSAATTLASQGYIITAFGGNGPDGYILVGTKVQGDTLPRPILISPANSVSTNGYALVGWAVNAPYSANASPPVWIFEK